MEAYIVSYLLPLDPLRSVVQPAVPYTAAAEGQQQSSQRASVTIDLGRVSSLDLTAGGISWGYLGRLLSSTVLTEFVDGRLACSDVRIQLSFVRRISSACSAMVTPQVWISSHRCASRVDASAWSAKPHLSCRDTNQIVQPALCVMAPIGVHRACPCVPVRPAPKRRCGGDARPPTVLVAQSVGQACHL